MPIMLFAVVAGLVIGLLGGGSWRHVGRRSARLWVLLLGAIALQIAADLSTGDPAVRLLLGSYALLAAFAVANLHLIGMAVVLVGIVMNLVVVAVNEGMPVRGDALVSAGVAERAELPTLDLGPWRHLEGPDDRLTVLGDVIPIPRGREVLSFGDVVIAVGAVDVVARLLLPPGTHRRRRLRRRRRSTPAHAGGRRRVAGAASRPSPEPS